MLITNNALMQNRELSWLKFNERVLQIANSESTPLIERLKFVSIFSSNLDEFYMVRVGSLLDYVQYEVEYFDNKTGANAEQQLKEIFVETRKLYTLKDTIFESIISKLEENGIYKLKINELNHSEYKFIQSYYNEKIMPLLSPQIIDHRHPFPNLDNKQLNVAVSFRAKRGFFIGNCSLKFKRKNCFNRQLKQ